MARHCQSSVIPEDTRGTVVLLTSEIVTNAVLHGRSQTQLTNTITTPCVRVDVTDDNSRHPTVIVRDDDALDGRGMALVAILSTTWGTRDETMGKTVWFELQL